MKRHILVLFHANATDKNIESTGVFHFSRYWKKMGYQVTFQKGTGRFIPADLVFVHVDLSIVPDDYLEYAAQYPRTINAAVRDIRKTVISENLVYPGDGWQGPVITKSDLNCAGMPEYKSSARSVLDRHTITRNLLGLWDRLTRNTGRRPFDTWEDYRIYDHHDQVPINVGRNPCVVTERFLPEVEEGQYHLRMYQFLGDRWHCRRMSSPQPLVKANASTRVINIEPHPVVESWRARYKLDYGKLDYVIHDGEPVLLDVNKTPVTNSHFSTGKDSERIRQERAEGIRYFFDR